MTKKEILNEIKNVVINNGGMIRLGWVSIFVLNGELIRDIHTHAKKVKYEKVEQIKIYLDCIRDYVTKKNTIIGLHKNGEVKCSLATAKALATEGYIVNERYKDGALCGEIDYDAVLKAMFEGDEYEVMQSVADYDAIGWEDLEIATDMYDNGYLTEIGYDGLGNWYGVINWNDVITDFCKRWYNKLNVEKEAA